MHIVAGEPHSISVLELRLEFELREREREDPGISFDQSAPNVV